MPDIQLTDQLDRPIEEVHVDLAHPSSLLKYLKTELLHMAVLPDFLERKDQILSQAATTPIEFQGSVANAFQLGNMTPQIFITPAAEVTIRVNASPGSTLFRADPFGAPTIVPDQTGYVSAGFEGSLSLDAVSFIGNLNFGFDKTSTVSLEYLKAFPLGAGEPTLGKALSRTLSSFTIPADLSDLDALQTNDVATVSGTGSLKISGGLSVAVFPNPLAAVELPLGAGTAALKAGAIAGLSTSFKISGSYQMRVRRIDGDSIELSFLRERGKVLKMDLSASAGISAKLNYTDLIATVLDAISTDPVGDNKLLADLRPEELGVLARAIEVGLDHSLQASMNATLSALRDDQAAFQYEIRPAQLSPEAKVAVHKALAGDLGMLTALEDSPHGAILPGVKVLNSVFTETRKRGLSLRLNLLGILNYVTVSELIRKSEILVDAVSGDVTIKEIVTGNHISAILEPMKRDEALRKVIFDSLLVTTSYRAGKAVALPDLSCSQVHFALNQNTNRQIMSDYLRWFMALHILTPQDEAAVLEEFIDGGPSSCVLRTTFDDPHCVAMFFDSGGELRSRQEYLDIGRQAMRALFDKDHQAIDRLRHQIVDDRIWPEALKIGASRELGPLVGLGVDDPRVLYLIGDVLVITAWANAMVHAGALIQDLRSFVGESDLKTLLADNQVQGVQFKAKRQALQKMLANVVKTSKTRFDEPWGMVCLLWASGSSRGAYAKAVTDHLTLERGTQIALTAAG